MSMDDDERARVAALRAYCPPDAPEPPELAGILRIAATIAGVTTATINLLDDEVQQNYATVGFDGGVCPASDSMCRLTVIRRRPQSVVDASVDPNFTANPWVDGRLGKIRFYASSPITTRDGHIIGTLCVFDTAPRTLPPAQEQALHDLAAQVMALLERRRLAREATAAAEAKSRFLAALSHEIRTPLGGVLGMLDLLLMSELDDEQHHHANVARRSAETLLALLDGVLDLSKGEAGHVILASVPFNLVELTHDVVEVLSPLTRRHGTRISVRVEGAVPPRLIGDPNRLRQVLANLVGNALKFTVEGEVEVIVRARSGGVEIAVRDTGVGIAPEELKELFRPFAQGDAGARFGGTGLGLFISRELVRLMGGEITCESRVGVGTTMSVALHLESAVDEALAEPDVDDLRILVVDDDEVNRVVTVALLEAAGVEVEAVEDGEEAVDRVRERAFDLVLVDLELPRMDGAAIARAIRAIPSNVEMRALTGHVGGLRIDEALAAGMCSALQKPLRQADVEALLRELTSDAYANAS
ncbi:MAG: response regulator [Myxococcales bacterium]|nr:response regulator [Myxococcales bacterium]